MNLNQRYMNKATVPVLRAGGAFHHNSSHEAIQPAFSPIAARPPTPKVLLSPLHWSALRPQSTPCTARACRSVDNSVNISQ